MKLSFLPTAWLSREAAGQPKRVNAYMNALSARFKQPDQRLWRRRVPTQSLLLHAYQWYYAVAISCNVALWGDAIRLVIH